VSGSRGRSSASGGSVLLFRRTTRNGIVALAAVAVLLAGGVLALGLAPSGPAHSGAAVSAAPPLRSSALVAAAHGSHGLLPAASFPTHGDLVVNATKTVTIQPTSANQTYYQGGNITVHAGGTLIVRNTTLSFVQFIGSFGTAQTRLSHVFHFVDQGTVDLYNSTITTDVLQVDGYAKLPLSILNGTMTLWNSTLAFPGWVTVNGSSAVLVLNGSRIQPNPAIANVSEPKVLLGDDAFAPDIQVSAGAHVELFGSNVSGLYADNQTANGTPTPVPLNATEVSILNTSTENFTLSTTNDSMSLAQDWAYPSGVLGGRVDVHYSDGSLFSTRSNVTVWYNGVPYALGTVEFQPLTTDGVASVAFPGGPTGLAHAIDALGMLAYLNLTGDFDVSSVGISAEFSNTVGPSVTFANVSLVLDPELSYNVVLSGKGTQLSTVDTLLGVNFGLPPTSPFSLAAPLPWNSNKLVLSLGATSFLANLEVPSPYLGVFKSAGAIVTDATSQAYLYRWAEFNLTGANGTLRVTGAHATAYYAYSGQANNATANSLNSIQLNNSAIWSYLQYWDGVHALPAYGTSGTKGAAYLLLASDAISAASGPDGSFLGDYHIVVTVPSISSTQSFQWGSISPYPAGVAQNTPGYGQPDFGPSLIFPTYVASLKALSIAITANGTAAASVRIGQLLGVHLTLNDTGPAPILSVSVALYYNSTERTLLDFSNFTTDLATIGKNRTFNVTWLINDSVTGQHGTFLNDFQLVFTWNDLLPQQGGGQRAALAPVTIAPSTIRLTFTPPSTTLIAGALYRIRGIVQFNGTLGAQIDLTARPTGGGTPIVLASGNFTSGPGYTSRTYTLDWSSTLLTAGTNYNLTLSALYNGKTQSITAVGPFAIPSTSTSSSPNFLEQTFVGIPVWLWIVIAGIVVVAGYMVLRIARRSAAGKLVECGECGALIPESANVCPKCGAEFESELVRCSRCSSTIPASSTFCPECSVQLLGKPGEAAEDPERQGYEDFTNRYRAEGKKELGENYTEGAFWDWWKRQPSYTPFSQWKLQQGQGTARAGMSAPPAGPASPEAAPARPPSRPPGGAASYRSAPAPETKAPSAPLPPPPGAGGLKPCPSCGKEIPPEYLVCPFCGSVTQ